MSAAMIMLSRALMTARTLARSAMAEKGGRHDGEYWTYKAVATAITSLITTLDQAEED